MSSLSLFLCMSCPFYLTTLNFYLSAYNFPFITGFEQFYYATFVGFLHVSCTWDLLSFLDTQLYSVHVWKTLGLNCSSLDCLYCCLKISKLFFCPVWSAINLTIFVPDIVFISKDQFWFLSIFLIFEDNSINYFNVLS